MQIRACRRLGGFEPDIRHASDDFLILLELVRTTGACALLPDLVLTYGAPGVAVRSLAEGTLGREVFLITRRSRTPAIAAVAAALSKAAAADAAVPPPRGRGSSPRRRAAAG
jgi:DNA-binding transcriptional LysR family regulator